MNAEIKGLTTEEAVKLRAQWGKNELIAQKKQSFFKKFLHIVSEPMFLLLIVAAVIYFILGEPLDGAVMLVFIAGIIGIEVIQEWKTDKTLQALKDLSAPQVQVIRDGTETVIPSTDLLPGDVMMIAEGTKIPADGRILKASDLLADESSLTGESLGVWKSAEADTEGGYWRKDYCYAGTLVIKGQATVLVEKIGQHTEYGKIGQHIAEAPERPTPLEKQTRRLVLTCSVFALIMFLLTVVTTYSTLGDHELKARVIESLLAGITLAIAIIPEEFPVITTVFLSMGAWRLAKKNSLIRRLSSVETLGAVSVLCVDKTGTITQNQMEVRQTWSLSGEQNELLEVMGLACETDAYDPMEKAMLRYCEAHGITRAHLFESEFFTEYAFTDELKMMGHVWKHDAEIIVAVKGSPEQLLSLTDLSAHERARVEQKLREMSELGLRVIAAGFMKPETPEKIPERIVDCRLTLSGLIGLADPPRDSVKADIARCKRAGLRVIMITGDSGVTASAIARQIGMDAGEVVTGDMLSGMDDAELRKRVSNVNIFSRVIPEHKMRIIKALKDNGETVAMTGDGVNDAPALKYADIGIAMGKRGSEVSREAAGLVLLDDNFTTIVDTIADGRRIFDNIQKAIGYVLAIHIPIAFAALLAPLLRIPPDALLLLPLHVVLLELLIDPTCSIVLERQRAEGNVMEKKPRDPNGKLLTRGMLLKSVIQGATLLLAFFGSYYALWLTTGDGELARTMGLSVIMLGNIFLVLVNSSQRDSLFVTLKRFSHDRVMLCAALGTAIMLLLAVYSPLHTFFKLTPLSLTQFLAAFGLSFVSVAWYELVKLILRLRSRR